VGYWFAEELRTWEPPADLLTFLEAGEPPLVVSLGAMSLGDREAKSSTLFVSAIQRAGLRAIIQGWEEELKQMALPPTICAAGSLPHGWLLSRCAGMVHHGGFGTTAAGLRAGIPALVIPHIVDQFFWGQRVHELSAGPEPIRRPELDAERLVEALKEITENRELQASASRLGEQIRAQNGIDEAVRLIEETFGQ